MISVVIPTIGSKHLNKTIDHLFKQTVLPDEVILVVPKQYKKEINIITNNLKKRIKKNTETPERFKRKLLTEEEMAIIQSGGAYNNFYY